MTTTLSQSQSDLPRLAELADLWARFSTGKTGPTAEQLIAGDREDRV